MNRGTEGQSTDAICIVRMLTGNLANLHEELGEAVERRTNPASMPIRDQTTMAIQYFWPVIYNIDTST